MWNGHLVAVADRRYLLDATLDQAGLGASSIVIDIPSCWFDTWEKPIFIPISGGMVRYVAYPGRGGYKSKPAFRPGARREIVEFVMQIPQITRLTIRPAEPRSSVI
jgi:hypothetical protein